MRLANDAPIIAVPMCVKHIGGQDFHTVGEKYLTAIIEGAEGYPLSFPALGPVLDPAALLDQVDGVLFTGSPSNVAVHHYEGDRDRDDSPQDPGRDAITLPLIRAALERQVPIFNICRGFQELNVALGGTLHAEVHALEGRHDHRAPQEEDLDLRYGPRHPVRFIPGGAFERIAGAGEVWVNSLHRQGIDRLAPGLVAEGHAPDGTIEAVRVAQAHSLALGVQWHPEYKAAANPFSMKLYRALGEAARRRAAER